ncbi:hypothetical protein JKP88DRAFT_252024 [Tribonema minus]|uniref:Uncharacterized protein n=1 Tax=Tribonema minus TaxID=303371 RepID=A0A836CPC4_9STRA|nr:hypothetical protein JKP88DRAFT_252024 [Tribonema minus]
MPITEMKLPAHDGPASTPPLPAAAFDSSSIDEHMCPVCWELLCQLVFLECGLRLCEKCCALYLEGQLRDRTAVPACPAGCQSSVGYALPHPSSELSEFLAKTFPWDWERRMCEGERCHSSAAFA